MPKKETEEFIRSHFKDEKIENIHVPSAYYVKTEGKPGSLGFGFVTFAAGTDISRIQAAFPWHPYRRENLAMLVTRDATFRILPMFVFSVKRIQ